MSSTIIIPSRELLTEDSSASPVVLLSQQKDLDGATKLIGYPFDTLVYVLYESNTEIKDENEIDFDRKWLSDRIAELPR